MATWISPIYTLKAHSGKEVTIDVTTSVSPGLPPSKVLIERIIPLFEERGVRRIVDFGAGALRHSIPLLNAGFTVCAVDFEAGYQRPTASDALRDARKYSSFCRLVWPRDFLKDKRKWDAALVCYVLQTMPVPAERKLVLKSLRKKLAADSYILYMSRFHQVRTISAAQRVSDGYFMWPKRSAHSFYREFETEETHKMMEKHGFQHLRSLSERGTDQMFLYGKGEASWI